MAIAINEHSFSTGSLPVSSFVRPSRIFTANKNIVIRKAGTLKSDVHDQVVESILKILR